MEEKQAAWQTTDSRFVAFVDILGFKELVATSNHEDIYRKLHAISESKKFLQGTSDVPESQARYQGSNIYIASFSDSIVVFSKSDSIDNFYSFLIAVRWLFAKTISDGIPIKGALAHGTISVNKSSQIYFGKPIIDAYLMEEDVNYMGATCHHSIDSYLQTKIPEINPEIDEFLFETKTPLKSGYYTHLNINWFRQIRNATKVSPDLIRNVISTFKLSSSGPSRKYVDNTIKIFDDNYQNNIRLK